MAGVAALVAQYAGRIDGVYDSEHMTRATRDLLTQALELPLDERAEWLLNYWRVCTTRKTSQRPGRPRFSNALRRHGPVSLKVRTGGLFSIGFRRTFSAVEAAQRRSTHADSHVSVSRWSSLILGINSKWLRSLTIVAVRRTS